MFVPDVVQVEDGVFLSGEEAAHHHRFHDLHAIGLVINCTNDVGFVQKNRCLPSGEAVRYVRCRVNDDLRPREISKMASALPGLVDEIREARRRGVNALVHCRMGVQRSACVVAAYVMKTRGMS